MYTNSTKRDVLSILIGITLVLVLAEAALSASDTQGCKLITGVDFFEEETGWINLNIESGKDILVQGMIAVEDTVLEKLDLKVRNYNDEFKSITIRIRESVESPFQDSPDLAVAMANIPKTMTGEWFTFSIMPKTALEAGREYYVVVENDLSLDNVKIAASTKNPLTQGGMSHLKYLSEGMYNEVEYSVKYDLLFRTFNCGEVVQAAEEPEPVVEQQVSEAITAQAAKEVNEPQPEKDAEEEKESFASMALGSIIAKIIGGLIMIGAVIIVSYNVGKRSSGYRPAKNPLPKETQSRIHEYAVGSIEKYKEDTTPAKQRNETIFGGKF